MSNQPTQSFFFPDPFGTSEGVSIEATSLDDAYKQLEQRRPQDHGQEPQAQPEPEQPAVVDSAPAPEATESSRERTS